MDSSILEGELKQKTGNGSREQSPFCSATYPSPPFSLNGKIVLKFIKYTVVPLVFVVASYVKIEGIVKDYLH